MAIRKRRVRTLSLAAIVMAMGMSLCFLNVNAETALTEKEMSRVLGKEEGCYCTDMEDYGNCNGTMETCSGCSGAACTTMKIAGTRPQRCTGTGMTPKSCEDAGKVTCKTTVVCRTQNFDDKTCDDAKGECGPMDGYVCPMCSNGTSTPDELTTYVCQSISA